MQQNENKIKVKNTTFFFFNLFKSEDLRILKIEFRKFLTTDATLNEHFTE